MPNPPKGLVRAIQRDAYRYKDYADAPSGYWRDRRDKTLHEVEAKFSKASGEAIKLAIASVALFVIIDELAARGGDTDDLKAVYMNVTNIADGRSASQPLTHEVLENFERVIANLQSERMPTSALEHALERMRDKSIARFDGIVRRGGNSKPINTVYACVVYCVLWDKVQGAKSHKALTSAAQQITGLLPAQLRQQRNNLVRLRPKDQSLDKMFASAVADWNAKRSHNLSDYMY